MGFTMYNNKKIIGIIPARGGSKSIPKKNIYPLHGKPLILYTIESALKSKLLDKVIVSTDDPEIKAVAAKTKVQVIDRPSELAQDTTLMPPVLQHVVQYLQEKENFTTDYVVLLQATSPLRKPETIDAGIKKVIDLNAESLTSVTEMDHGAYYNSELGESDLLSFNLNIAARRQDLKKKYYLDGCLFVIRTDVLMKQERFVLSATDNHGLVVSREESIGIDDPFDLKLIENILKERTKQN